MTALPGLNPVSLQTDSKFSLGSKTSLFWDVFPLYLHESVSPHSQTTGTRGHQASWPLLASFWP